MAEPLLLEFLGPLAAKVKFSDGLHGAPCRALISAKQLDFRLPNRQMDKRLFRLLIVVYNVKVLQFHQPDILNMIGTMRFEQEKIQYASALRIVSSSNTGGKHRDPAWMEYG